MQIHGNMRYCIMDAIIAAGLQEKIRENMLLSANGQCYLWTAGRKGKITYMV